LKKPEVYPVGTLAVLRDRTMVEQRALVGMCIAVRYSEKALREVSVMAWTPDSSTRYKPWESELLSGGLDEWYEIYLP
jgi:hypothetical protein